MIKFFYTGICNFESNTLLEMLDLCQEYLLADLKQLVEHIMIANIDLENFGDTFEACKSYECKVLKEALYLYGRKNYQELYRKGQLKNLAKVDFLTIKPPTA